MKNENSNIDKFTEGLFTKIGLDEPSVDFTSKVMLTIANQAHTGEVTKKKNFYWLIFAVVPVVIIISLVIKLSGLTHYLVNYLNSAYSGLISFVKLITTPFVPLTHMTISPIMLVCITAVSLLLFIDGFTNRLVHK